MDTVRLVDAAWVGLIGVIAGSVVTGLTTLGTTVASGRQAQQAREVEDARAARDADKAARAELAPLLERAAMTLVDMKATVERDVALIGFPKHDLAGSAAIKAARETLAIVEIRLTAQHPLTAAAADSIRGAAYLTSYCLAERGYGAEAWSQEQRADHATQMRESLAAFFRFTAKITGPELPLELDPIEETEHQARLSRLAEG